MKKIYDGIAELDANGSATVQLPDGFAALTDDFRYQLTCIGALAPVFVSEEMAGKFRATGGVMAAR